jgi:hypothetical protein
MAFIAINMFGGEMEAPGQDMFQSSATQVHPLGTRYRCRDGRVFFYTSAGVSDLVAGTLNQGPAPIANHLAQTPPVVALGATSFVFTPGNTAGAANLYAEGFMQVDTTPGNGYTYSVSGHAAITASTAFTLNLNEPIQVALTASSRVGLIHNTYKNTIQVPTTSTGAVIGVSTYIITAAQYGWQQTWGPSSVLINGTPAVTAPVINSVTTAGAVDVWTAAAQPTSTLVGNMMQVGVSTKNNFVNLRLQA